MENRWKNIWEKRMLNSDYEDVLTELIRLDGFDGKTGKIEQEAWLKYIEYIQEYIGIKENDSIFEIGCGSGAFLYPFYTQGHKVGGLDYSESLITAAKTLWNAPVECMEAIELPVSPLFDIVLSNSVFFYFPNLEYAEKVILKMIEKANRVVAILEVPDAHLYEVSEKMRRGVIGEEEYRIKYAGLHHLYYEKDWFRSLGEKYGLKTSITNQSIDHYKNNDFRFNCIFTKV